MFNEFVEDVIKKKKEEAERLKRLEAEKLRQLQQNQNTFAETNGSGSKWYFNNAKTRAEGYDEFRKMWGPRENEDNWRRSDKTVLLPITNLEDDTTAVVSEEKTTEKKDSITVEQLMADVPLTDSALSASKTRLLEALYAAGVIYKDQLNEPDLAAKQFNAVLAKETVCETDMSSAFQLYKMYNEAKPELANPNKDHILTLYPNSDYAN